MAQGNCQHIMYPHHLVYANIVESSDKNSQINL